MNVRTSLRALACVVFSGLFAQESFCKAPEDDPITFWPYLIKELRKINHEREGKERERLRTELVQKSCSENKGFRSCMGLLCTDNTIKELAQRICNNVPGFAQSKCAKGGSFFSKIYYFQKHSEIEQTIKDTEKSEVSKLWNIVKNRDEALAKINNVLSALENFKQEKENFPIENFYSQCEKINENTEGQILCMLGAEPKEIYEFACGMPCNGIKEEKGGLDYGEYKEKWGEYKKLFGFSLNNKGGRAIKQWCRQQKKKEQQAACFDNLETAIEGLKASLLKKESVYEIGIFMCKTKFTEEEKKRICAEEHVKEIFEKKCENFCSVEKGAGVPNVTDIHKGVTITDGWENVFTIPASKENHQIGNNDNYEKYFRDENEN